MAGQLCQNSSAEVAIVKIKKFMGIFSRPNLDLITNKGCSPNF